MKGPTNSSARPNIRLLNVSATFESNPDTSNNTEFPYRASIQADGVNEYMSATVMFSQIQATSGNFATYCQTDDGVIYIYSKTDAGTITIPAVSCDLSVNYINVDNVPTEDSQAVITSGGVYDALEDYVTKDTAQTINGNKTFTSVTKFNDITLDNNAKTYLYAQSDNSGIRSCNRADNTTSDRRALFEILSNNDGSIQMRLQKRTVANDTYLGGDFVSRMEVVDIANYPAGIEKTGIGTKLATCKYCILDWHDSRATTMHISTLLTGQGDGYSFGTSFAIYEFNQETTPFMIGIRVLYTSANRIDVVAKSCDLINGTWYNYLGYMNFEKITFIYA